MKKIVFFFVYTVTAIAIFPQSMVIQKNDSTNLFIDLNTIDKINFIIPCPGTPTVDYEGKTYNTVLIGNQCWLKENLDAGNMVNGSSGQGNNGIIEKYCYNNVEDSCNIYGGLYLWYEAMQYSTTEGARGICPIGWHIPKLSEYQTLLTYVDSLGNALKREDQGTGTDMGTNTYGFDALLSGGKHYIGSSFINWGAVGAHWISKRGSGNNNYAMRLMNNDGIIYIDSNTIDTWGYSVRCIKD